MRVKILRYLKHLGLTILVLLTIAIVIGLQLGAAANYGDNPLMFHLDKEGPYVFYKNDSTLNINYIRGNKNDGFYVDRQDCPVDSLIGATSFFALDSSCFHFTINTEIGSPPTTYKDEHPILAISDIESGYKTFRDFLINNKVIDEKLNWIFGRGHLVLVGDFIDRGCSTTQVLWLIYKLEQSARLKGGFVHYILGNHELKNLQGKYDSASPKYYGVAAILGKQQHHLYDSNSFIGRWMASKNSVELINDHLFAHGGIHPDVAEIKADLNEINQIIRSNYYLPYFPKQENTVEQLLTSTKKGVNWYRGYFKEDLTQEQIENILKRFGAKAVVVGHTLQSRVNSKYNGRVIGIDIRHPKDYRKTWPHKDSEGLLIKGDKYFRVFSDGRRKPLSL